MMVTTSPHGKILRKKEGETEGQLARRQQKEFEEGKKKNKKKK